MIGDAEAQHRGVAKPKRQAGDKADLGHFDGVEPVVGIDAVTHSAARENGGADIVTDRIAREACERGNAIRNLLASDRAQGKPVVEGQREITARDEKCGGRDMLRLGRFERRDHFVDVGVAQHVKKNNDRDRNDRNAQHHANAIPADCLL